MALAAAERLRGNMFWWWSAGPVAPVSGSLASVSVPLGSCGYNLRSPLCQVRVSVSYFLFYFEGPCLINKAVLLSSSSVPLSLRLGPIPACHTAKHDNNRGQCLPDQRQPEEQDDLQYTSIHFSNNQADPLYSNIRAAQPHRHMQEQEVTEYTAVRFNRGSAAKRPYNNTVAEVWSVARLQGRSGAGEAVSFLSVWELTQSLWRWGFRGITVGEKLQRITCWETVSRAYATFHCSGYRGLTSYGFSRAGSGPPSPWGRRGGAVASQMSSLLLFAEEVRAEVEGEGEGEAVGSAEEAAEGEDKRAGEEEAAEGGGDGAGEEAAEGVDKRAGEEGAAEGGGDGAGEEAAEGVDKRAGEEGAAEGGGDGAGEEAAEGVDKRAGEEGAAEGGAADG
ncbi:hypothetical protein ACER0C_031650 [Sarotherodon galilaeus]